jgi:hypothetical protein
VLTLKSILELTLNAKVAPDNTGLFDSKAMTLTQTTLDHLNRILMRRDRGGRESTLSLPQDIQLFLDCYSNEENLPDANDNLRFYSNTLPCRPDELLIEDIHKQYLLSHSGRYSDICSHSLDGGETTECSSTIMALFNGSSQFVNMG